MTDSGTERLMVAKLSDDLGVDERRLFDEMGRYNSRAQHPKSEKTLDNWYADGIPSRESASRAWLHGFLTWLANQSGHQLNAGNLVGLITELTSYAPANTPSKPKQTKAKLAKDIKNFGMRLSAAEAGNDSLASNRARQSGYYKIIRKTTQDGEAHFYEEPLKIGGAQDATWLISANNGLNEGFTFSSNGVTNVILSHEHDKHRLGLRVIQLDFDGNSRDTAFSGVMLRLSDSAFRPAASKIVAVKLPDDDPEVVMWTNYAERYDPDNDESFNHDFVTEVRSGHMSFATYEALRLDEHLKAELSTDWVQIKKAILSSS